MFFFSAGHEGKVSRDSGGKISNRTESGEESGVQLEITKGMHYPNDGLNEYLSPVSSEGICPVLGEFAEWEIPWEDLQIGERIGIGQLFYSFSYIQKLLLPIYC